MDLVKTIEEYLKQELGEGSTDVSGSGRKFYKACKRAIEEGVTTIPQFVAICTDTNHFGKCDNDLMKGLLTFASSQGHEVTEADRSQSFVPPELKPKNYDDPLERIRELIRGLVGSTRLVAALSSLGIKTCRMYGIRVVGDVVYKDGQEFFKLSEDESEYFYSLGLSDEDCTEAYRVMESHLNTAKNGKSIRNKYNKEVKEVVGLNLGEIYGSYQRSRTKADPEALAEVQHRAGTKGKPAACN
jgi:hypothetical protein